MHLTDAITSTLTFTGHKRVNQLSKGGHRFS